MGIFMIACISLMIFNFIIIRYSQRKNTHSADRIEKWRTILYKQAHITPGAEPNALKHGEFLLRKLSNTENLIEYTQALQSLKGEFPEAYSGYAHKFSATFQKLADVYSRKPRIERTCYADFICTFPQVAGDAYGQLVETLISYIDDSNIHCRTKVLATLCHLGSVQGVANLLQIIHDRALFMHTQLLTNELSNFSDDKEVLGDHLWRESRHWNDNISVSVIQFITRFSPHYRDIFLPVLQDTSASPEVRAAIIRYYGEYIYDPARPILSEFITNPTDVNLAIEAESVLASYPKLDMAIAVKSKKSKRSKPNWRMQFDTNLPLAQKIVDKLA